MNKIKETASRIKNHVAHNKAAYVMSAVAIAAIALQQSNRVEFYKFLESRGIDPEEYYSPETYEERNA